MFIVSIGFSRPRRWKIIAQLIMWLGGTNYSHTFITWKCTAIKRRKVFEAVGSGLRILSNVTFKKEALVVELYRMEVSDEDIVKLEQLAHDMAATRYGFKALMGMLVVMSFNWFNRTFGIKGRQTNPFKDGKQSNVCIEICARALCELQKIPVPDDIESYMLCEFNAMTSKYAEKVPQEKIDRINGIK